MTKRKPVSSAQKQPLRLNLNLRTRTNAKNAQWKHYQGLSFICEASDLKQAEEFAGLLREAAMALAVKLKMVIPGAIYIPQAVSSGTTENQAPANQA